VDLHRHLTGSLPRTTLREVLEVVAPAIAQDTELVTPTCKDTTPASQQQAWDILTKQCHAVKVAGEDLSNFQRLVGGAIDELARDNVFYCEFRVGVKAQPTKKQFLDDLTHIIKQKHKEHPHVHVRILCSVARHGDVEYGAENVQVAIDDFTAHKGESVVVGIELGGVVTKGRWKDFEPLFLEARRNGLKTALHCGENHEDESEVWQMLDFHPGRLGHCVFFREKAMAKLQELRIPVETCLTCHERCFCTPIQDNVFSKLRHTDQVLLCTDNPSFYDVTLSEEYSLCCKHHSLTVAQLFALARRGIDFAFCPEQLKATLRADFDAQARKLVARFGL